MEHLAAPYIGTAGWSLASAVRGAFDPEGSQLVRYASRLNCAEINSSFYRPHRPSTYERWRASVPPAFRFAVKMPRTITHEARLRDTDILLAKFLGEVVALGDALGPLLVQLPASLAFDADTTERFLMLLRELHSGEVVLEPRHRNWFEAAPNDMLVAYHIGRVGADPAVCSAAAEPGGWTGTRYWRLHGSPKMYYTPYGEARLAPLATSIRSTDWVIFDNTASGAATLDALALTALVQRNAPIVRPERDREAPN